MNKANEDSERIGLIVSSGGLCGEQIWLVELKYDAQCNPIHRLRVLELE